MNPFSLLKQNHESQLPAPRPEGGRTLQVDHGHPGPRAAVAPVFPRHHEAPAPAPALVSGSPAAEAGHQGRGEQDGPGGLQDGQRDHGQVMSMSRDNDSTNLNVGKFCV